MDITRVFDILELYKTDYNKDDILCSKVNKQWKKYSGSDFINNANLVSSALLALGLTRDDKVAIISNTVPNGIFVILVVNKRTL